MPNYILCGCMILIYHREALGARPCVWRSYLADFSVMANDRNRHDLTTQARLGEGPLTTIADPGKFACPRPIKRVTFAVK
jgi:hypothetical protein